VRVFPRRFTPGTPLCTRGLAEGLAKMAMFWEQLEVVNGILDWPAGRPRIMCGGAANATITPRSFRLTSSGNNNEVASITEGRFVVHGIGTYSVAADTVTLTGGPYVWVYAHASANNWNTNGIAVASGTVDQEPRTGNAQVIVTLYEFQYVAESYSLTNVRAGGQDVQFMAAIRGGN